MRRPERSERGFRSRRNGLENLTDEQTPQGEISYGYDAASRRSTMQVVGQTAVSYTWDNANRLTQITWGTANVGLAGACPERSRRNAANRRTQLTLPNGVTVSYSYDGDSRVTQLAYGAGGQGSSNLGTLTYTGACPERSRRDADGRRTAMGGSLAAVNLPANVSGNTFNGNEEMTGFNGVTLRACDFSVCHSERAFFCESKNRREAIFFRISSGIAPRRSLDTESPLAPLRAPKRRLGMTTGQEIFSQILTGGCSKPTQRDGFNPVQELAAGTPPASVTANLLNGLNIDEYFQRIDSSGAMSFLTDALGSTIALTNGAGAIQTQYTYEPFGNVTVSGASNANPYQFTGRENDGTGLYYYRARYYSPTYQRFIAQDPIDFAGGDADLYGYVGNDPVSHRDETGKGFWTGLAVGAACAAYVGYSYYSNLSELNKLGQEKEQLGQQINNLRQQQNSCDNAEKQAELDQQIEPLEQQYQNLVEQYTAAHAADSFGDEAKIAACVLATRLASLSPLP